jgi:uncharacterized protein YecT (DUF1311 family)
MRRPLLLALALLSAAASPAAALNCGPTAATVDMIECAKADFAAADRRLNDAYQKLMKDPDRDEKGRNLLREAQRKWIPFRDAQCLLEEDEYRGGTLAAVMYGECQARITAERARALEEMLNRKQQ